MGHGRAGVGPLAAVCRNDSDIRNVTVKDGAMRAS